MFLEISFILLLCLKVITILYKNEFKVDMSLLTQKMKYEKAEITEICKYLSIYISIKNNERTNKNTLDVRRQFNALSCLKLFC